MFRTFMIFTLLTLYFFAKNINAVGLNNVTNSVGRDIFLNKCCGIGEVIGRRKTCVKYDATLSFANIEIYNKNIYKTGKTVEDAFTLKPGKFADRNFKKQAFDITLLNNNLYVIENGVLIMETPNVYDRWNHIPNDQFCLDYKMTKGGTELSSHFYGFLLAEDFVEDILSIYMVAASVVSCLFMLLVLIVYLLLPELRNFSSKIQTILVANLFLAFLLFMNMVRTQHQVAVCVALTMATYFFFLSSFCWTSVISFDIWWTFRAYVKRAQQRGENLKLKLYCCYAFGVPLIMTVCLFILNSVSMRHLPWFITPNVPTLGCFLEGGSQLVYLNIPILILIICSWIFDLLTVINLRRLSQSADDLESDISSNPQAYSSHKNRLMQNILQLIFMTIYVNVKIFGNFTYGLVICVGLMGPVIFIIYVCAKNTLKRI